MKGAFTFCPGIFFCYQATYFCDKKNRLTDANAQSKNIHKLDKFLKI